MKNIKSLIYILLGFCGLLTLGSCKKYLDVKPSAKLVIPGSVQDLQALLDQSNTMITSGTAVAEASADDYYLTDVSYGSLTTDGQRMYTWQKDNLFPALSFSTDWTRAYNRIFYANIALESIEKIAKMNVEDWNDIKSQALFARALAFYELVTTWSLAYDETSADGDPGVPLRLTGDINEKIKRPTLKETYQQILQDLNEAAPLAKVKSLHVIRSSRPAVYALLARTYLAMRDYENCFKYADLCLQLKSDLLDFNNNPPLNAAANFPFNNTTLVYKNPEIIHGTQMTANTGLRIGKVASDFRLTYDDNDLRKQVYFRANTDQTYSFKGSLIGSIFFFNGIAVNEVYLMRAECYARKEMITEAMQDLNTLLIKRWNRNAVFTPFTAANGTEALQLILRERRKELLLRGLRWMDLKRLNKEGANITLRRVVNGQTFTLPPNDNRYALEIPKYVIEINGIPQNVR